MNGPRNEEDFDKLLKTTVKNDNSLGSS
jgi:hypothetical protein